MAQHANEGMVRVGTGPGSEGEGETTPSSQNEAGYGRLSNMREMVRADFKHISVDSPFVNGKPPSASPGKDGIADAEDVKEPSDGESWGVRVVGMASSSLLQQETLK